MNRRTFIQISTVAAGASAHASAASLPMTKLGKSGLMVSKFCLGGYHMRVGGEAQGVQIIHRAIDLGVNFFDSAHHYHRGESDKTLGVAMKGGLRQKVLLMSKAQLRDRDSAMKQLEDTLTRMNTDYLDLWQCHEVVSHAEVDKILGPGGSLEAFVAAKKQGKARHIGFTGHADPGVHQRLLDAHDGWETVQMPVNLIDPHYLSFIENVIPRARKKGLGILAMKSNAMGPIRAKGIATIQECLRFAWSQDVDVVVSGVETVQQLEENVGVLKSFQKMTPQEITTLLQRTKKGEYGSSVEQYKKKESAAMTHPVHRDGEPV